MKTQHLLIACLLMLAGLLFSGLVGCQQEHGLRIGTKDFAEQELLAEIASELLTREGISVEPIKPCGDTFSCQRAMREGNLDVMIEYSGTGLVFLGQPPSDTQASLPRVRELYQPLGLEWLDGLGFDNGYRVLVDQTRAESLGLQTISNLDKLQPGVRVVCPPSFLRRPRDGLNALLSRHGLRLQGEALVLPTPQQRLQALQRGRADVLIGYSTDGTLRGLGLTTLEDTLNFFPSYEAAYVVRKPLLKSYPKLAPTLNTLAGLLKEDTMQELNYAVEVQGQDPALVARAWLQAQKMTPTSDKSDAKSIGLLIAVHQDDQLAPFLETGVRALHQTFPKRAVRHIQAKDPAKQVIHGSARLALLGAERFFSRDRKDRLVRNDRLEAAAVVGERHIHIIRRAGSSPQDKLQGKLGLPPSKSGAGMIARALVDNQTITQQGTTEELLTSLRAGKLDAILVVEPPGAPALTQALADETLVLHPAQDKLTPVKAARHPFLRPTRIPARTYQRYPNSMDTISVQVVLASPAKRINNLTTGAGPAAALPYTGTPLKPEEVERLTAATGLPALPDPSLPSAWNTNPRQGNDSNAQHADMIKTVLNLLALLFLAWLALLVRPDNKESQEETQVIESE